MKTKIFLQAALLAVAVVPSVSDLAAPITVPTDLETVQPVTMPLAKMPERARPVQMPTFKGIGNDAVPMPKMKAPEPAGEGSLSSMQDSLRQVFDGARALRSSLPVFVR